MMYLVIKKRDGRVVPFDREKIVSAINKAMIEVGKENDDLARRIAKVVEDECSLLETSSVEDIQDLVEKMLMKNNLFDVAKAYIRYRYKREVSRAFDQRYESVISLIKGTNEEANTENSNKDTRIIPTMRDYLAGFTCKEVAEHILPKDVLEAHKEGLIHFHK